MLNSIKSNLRLFVALALAVSIVTVGIVMMVTSKNSLRQDLDWAQEQLDEMSSLAEHRQDVIAQQKATIAELEDEINALANQPLPASESFEAEDDLTILARQIWIGPSPNNIQIAIGDLAEDWDWLRDNIDHFLTPSETLGQMDLILEARDNIRLLEGFVANIAFRLHSHGYMGEMAPPSESALHYVDSASRILGVIRLQAQELDREIIGILISKLEAATSNLQEVEAMIGVED